MRPRAARAARWCGCGGAGRVSAGAPAGTLPPASPARVGAASASGLPGAAAPAATSGAASGNTYTVQRRDTLVALSRKFYGNDTEWKRILDANKSLLGGDPAKLKPGMKLAIPAKR